MNTNQAQLLAGMANYIKGVDRVDYCQAPDVYFGRKDKGIDVDGCFIAHAMEGGFIEKSNLYDWTDRLRQLGSILFGITEEEMGEIVYIPITDYQAFDGSISYGRSIPSGADHFTACKELLDKYGYAHLLDKPDQLSGAEVVKQFLREEKVVRSQKNLKQFVVRESKA